MEKLKEILTNHWTIIISIFIGIIIGVKFPNLATTIDPFGKIYIKLSLMCCSIMLPFIIISSIGSIMVDANAQKIILKILIGLLLNCLFIAFLSICGALIISPIFAPNFETQKAVGKLLIAANEKTTEANNKNALSGYHFIRELNTKKNNVTEEHNWLVDFILEVVPENIFNSLSVNNIIQIIFFSFIFGILIKFFSPEVSEMILKFCNDIYAAFQELVVFLLYFLPFALITILAEQTIGLKFDIFFSLFRLAGMLAFVCLFIFSVCLIIIKKKTKKSFVTILKTLKEPMLLSFAASDNIVAMPSLLKNLINNFGFNKNKTELITPLWLGLEFHTTILLFATASIFVMQLYEAPFTISAFIGITIESIVAGASTMAAPPGIWVTLISIVLIPMQLPYQPISLALILFEPFFNGILYMLNVLISATAVSILAKE